VQDTVRSSDSIDRCSVHSNRPTAFSLSIVRCTWRFCTYTWKWPTRCTIFLINLSLLIYAATSPHTDVF